MTRHQPVEPSIVASPETVRVQSGVPGKALDPDEVADRLLDAGPRRGGPDHDRRPSRVATRARAADADADLGRRADSSRRSHSA